MPGIDLLNTPTRRPLLFEHIPKTAGLSLAWVLNREYHTRFSTEFGVPEKSLPAFLKLDRETISRFDLVKGHGVLSLKNLLADPVTLTMVRDPMKRFVSQYHFIRRDPSHVSHQNALGMKNILEYTDYARHHNEDNIMVRFLSGSIWPVMLHSDFSPVPCDEAMFRQAVHQLEQFDYIFDTSCFDHAILYLHRQLQWKRLPFYVRQNTSRRPSTRLDETSSKAIAESERFDIRLYRHAVQLMSERHDLGSVSALLPRWRRQQAVYALVRGTARKVRFAVFGKR